MRFRFPFSLRRPRGKDLLNDLREWCRHESVRPDLSAKFEYLRSELELPSLSELAERIRREADGVSLSALFDRLDTGRARRRTRQLLNELQDEAHWPRLHALVDKLQSDIDLPSLPEIPTALTGQQRQALKGLMLLGMVLHTLPVKVPNPGPSTVGGPADIAETRGSGTPGEIQAATTVRFVLREAPPTQEILGVGTEKTTADATAAHPVFVALPAAQLARVAAIPAVGIRCPATEDRRPESHRRSSSSPRAPPLASV